MYVHRTHGLRNNNVEVWISYTSNCRWPSAYTVNESVFSKQRVNKEFLNKQHIFFSM